MFTHALVVLCTDETVSVNTVTVFASEREAQEAGERFFPEATERNEWGQQCDEDGEAFYEVVKLVTVEDLEKEHGG